MMFPRLNLRASLTLHETLSVHDLMNRQKIEFITYIYILYCLSSINFQLSYNLAGFLDILNYTRHNRGFGTAKRQIPAFNVMTIRARLQTNASKQTTLLDGVDVGPPKQRVCWCGFNRSVHEAMDNISNVKVHLKTRSGK